MFKDIKLTWGGEEKVLRANRVLKGIAIVEQFITIDKLATFEQGAKVASLAQAYGALLRFVGFKLTDEEVYEGIFSSADQATVAKEAASALLALMIPPSTLAAAQKKIEREEEDERKAEEDRKAGNDPSASSKKVTKRLSRASRS
jgi:hypothetical protein